jgi:hypothetical protein
MAAIGGALLLLATAVTAADTVLHPFLVAQPKQAPQEVNLAVEIPAGSFTKYEIKEDGLVHGIASSRCRSPIRPTTARCRARWPATTIRWTRWC